MRKVHPPGYCLFNRGYGNLLLRLQNPAYSSLGTIYSPQTPRSSSFNMSHRLSQPWTTRRMPSEMRPSLTSDWSLHNPVKLERALTSSSACKNMDTNPPPQSATILPLRSSAQELRLVSTSNTISVIRAKTQQVGAARLGFSPEDVGMHSLLSVGAIAMHIAGVPYRTLMTIRR